MTKRRKPLTSEQALTDIAALIGFASMAAAIEKATGRECKERTVRDWSDPDVAAEVSFTNARHLDLAYQAAGGVGAPLFEVYSLLLEVERATRFADLTGLTTSTMLQVKEHAEAIEATLAVTLPGAPASAYERAVRESEEAISAATNTLALLRQAGERMLREATGPPASPG